ncbi:hypothetical protein COBT_001429 [Conglomerata obtusa]
MIFYLRYLLIFNISKSYGAISVLLKRFKADPNTYGKDIFIFDNENVRDCEFVLTKLVNANLISNEMGTNTLLKIPRNYIMIEKLIKLNNSVEVIELKDLITFVAQESLVINFLNCLLYLNKDLSQSDLSENFIYYNNYYELFSSIINAFEEDLTMEINNAKVHISNLISKIKDTQLKTTFNNIEKNFGTAIDRFLHVFSMQYEMLYLNNLSVESGFEINLCTYLVRERISVCVDFIYQTFDTKELNVMVQTLPEFSSLNEKFVNKLIRILKIPFRVDLTRNFADCVSQVMEPFKNNIIMNLLRTTNAEKVIYKKEKTQNLLDKFFADIKTSIKHIETYEKTSHYIYCSEPCFKWIYKIMQLYDLGNKKHVFPITYNKNCLMLIILYRLKEIDNILKIIKNSLDYSTKDVCKFQCDLNARLIEANKMDEKFQNELCKIFWPLSMGRMTENTFSNFEYNKSHCLYETLPKTKKLNISLKSVHFEQCLIPNSAQNTPENDYIFFGEFKGTQSTTDIYHSMSKEKNTLTQSENIYVDMNFVNKQRKNLMNEGEYCDMNHGKAPKVPPRPSFLTPNPRGKFETSVYNIQNKNTKQEHVSEKFNFGA